MIELSTVTMKRRGRPEAGQTENPVVEIQGLSPETKKELEANEEIAPVLGLFDNTVKMLSGFVAEYYNDWKLGQLSGAAAGPSALDLLLAQEQYQDFFTATFGKIADDADKTANAKAALARRISTVVNTIGSSFDAAFEMFVTNWRAKQTK